MSDEKEKITEADRPRHYFFSAIVFLLAAFIAIYMLDGYSRLLALVCFGGAVFNFWLGLKIKAKSK